MFDWLKITGLLHAGVHTRKGKWFRRRRDPIFGDALKKLVKKGLISVKSSVVEVDGDQVTFRDGHVHRYQNIIWSTGFRPSYDWLQIDGAFTEKGMPIHERGISPIAGLYFIGLPWQHQRGSSLVCGVGYDAAYVGAQLKKYLFE